MTPTQFFQDFHITTATEQQLYVTNGKLNIAAYDLAWYVSLDQQQKQTVQQELVNTGQLAASDANGLNNSTALSAWKGLIGLAQQQGTDAKTWISNQVAASSGTNAIQNTISSQITAATKNLSAPITITESNPTTLSAAITSAFEQSLGYSPDQAQIDAFIKGINSQETTYGSAPRTQAQAEITQAHSQESALNALGANGIDSVIQAYQTAVNGTKLPGVGTQQGPVNGSVPNPTSPVPAGTPAPGSALPAGASFRYQNGQLVGSDVPAQQTGTQQVNNRPGLGQDIKQSLYDVTNAATGGYPYGGQQQDFKDTTHTAPTYGPLQHNTMPFAPANASGSTNTHGGMFALSPQDWADAAKLMHLDLKQYPTPGSAPVSVQHAAMTNLLTSVYEKNGGSWSKAIASIASGSPFGTAEGTHLSALGNQIAVDVNNQIKALQSQVTNDAITTKVSAPDVTAEANLAAKQSDPAGYEAAQTASWGSVLNKMLSGSPSMYNQSTADTFTGPVAAQAATAPTTVGAGGL
jgi:hypothetical protein